MNEQKTSAASLSQSQRFLIHWLAQADSSAYGECKGGDLDALLELDLATYREPPHGQHKDYGRVALTDAGYELAKNLS